MRSTSSKWGIAGVLYAAVNVMFAVFLVAGCSDSPSETSAAVVNEAQADGGRWDVLAIQADEVEGFSTLAEMAEMADVLVVAQATGIEGVRTIGPGEGGLDLAQVRFRVTRDLSGWEADSVLVEFTVANPEAMKALEEQVAGFPPTVIALREKGGPREAGLYRLVNSESLWTEQPDGGVIAPLTEDPEGEFRSELADVKSLDDLADHLETARR